MLNVNALVAGTVSARAAALVRIVVGSAAGLKALEIAPVLARFDDPSVLRIPYAEGTWSVLDLPSVVVLSAWLALATTFTLGIAVWVSGAALAGLLALVLVADQQLYSNHLYLLALLIALLAIGRAGAALSATGEQTAAVLPAWPYRLIRFQVSVVYLFAALSKVNAGFLSGTVLAIGLRDDGPFALPLAWRTFEIMASLSMLTILAELFLAAALWSPRWRRTAFTVGFLVHAGIAFWLEPTGQLVIFSMIMLATYLLFVDGGRPAATVVWDDSCGFCTGWVQLFRRLDWMQALHFVPSGDVTRLDQLGVPAAEADRAMQLVRGGRREQGFRAVVRVLELLPLTFLWAPLLMIPGAAWVGDRVYRRIAERRRCSVPQSQAN